MPERTCHLHLRFRRTKIATKERPLAGLGRTAAGHAWQQWRKPIEATGLARMLATLQPTRTEAMRTANGGHSTNRRIGHWCAVASWRLRRRRLAGSIRTADDVGSSRFWPQLRSPGTSPCSRFSFVPANLRLSLFHLQFCLHLGRSQSKSRQCVVYQTPPWTSPANHNKASGPQWNTNGFFKP